MLSAERRFTIARSLEDVYSVAHAELPGAEDIQPGTHTPMLFVQRRQRVRELAPGDRFTSLTRLVGVLTPIDWEVVESTSRQELLANRRARFQIASRGLLGAAATVVLNVYEGASSVSADLFVLIDEVVLTGDLQQSFMTAIENKIDSIVEFAREHFAVLKDVAVEHDE